MQVLVSNAPIVHPRKIVVYGAIYCMFVQLITCFLLLFLI